MWQLDDITKYALLDSFDYPNAFTSADKTKSRREIIRKAAAEKISEEKIRNARYDAKWWAFRIYFHIKPRGTQAFDIENASKLVIDAFSKKTLEADQSPFKDRLALFEDDSIEYVRVIEIGGKPDQDSKTTVEIFYCLIEEEQDVQNEP
ncbi:hypothetical protein KSD_30170 [Ktedonobacter sp. SOSP1-85]|uniref:hypothetical protein n=1 Tax=Ktedonobacter sp. SOSP1-85 TaxID=2778367 RepID=UPI001915304F|nr:hypothetical protein [Ktedonobacter sp. SOSP1-85]GHO75246.1 hypothetical protein KSD_30170 [Ktedonobacter sp. SOSP1-85]